jgi:hypothetical protein
MWGIWVPKDAEFYKDSKNINLPYIKVIPTKHFFNMTQAAFLDRKTMTSELEASGPKNMCFFAGALCKDGNLFPGITLFMYILSSRQIYTFEIYVKFCIFCYPYTYLPLSTQ